MIAIGAVLLPTMFAEDRARISHLEEQVKALSAPDAVAAACADMGRRLAEPSRLDVEGNIPPLKEALQRLGCDPTRRATSNFPKPPGEDFSNEAADPKGAERNKAQASNLGFSGYST
jgi:hypothetical protein